MKKTVLFILSISFSLSVYAQISYEKRIEFNLKDDYKNETVFEFGANGFLMTSEGSKASNNKKEWKYDLYGTNLELIKSKSVYLDDNYFKDEVYLDEKHIYTLFRKRSGKFRIIGIDVTNMNVSEIEGVIPKKSRIKEMSVLGNFAYFNSVIKNYPYLFSVDLNTGEQKMNRIGLENINPKRLSLKSFQVLKKTNKIFLFVKYYIKKKESDIYAVKLNNDGSNEKAFNLTKEIKQNIIDLSVSELNENQYVVIGTYSSKYTGLSEGLFFGITKNDKLEFIKAYNFLDLKNFLSYLPERKQEKIERKKTRKENKGKELKINYRIAGHDIIKTDDGYIFLGEAYFPTYRTEVYTRTTYVNGVPQITTATRTVFDGYQYTHAILTEFDTSGNLLWDQTFEMWPAYKPFYVKKFISIKEKHKNSTDLVYSSRNRIYSKSFDFDGSVLQDFESDVIKTGFEGDKKTRTYSNISYWYDNYFIVYGTQKIKNTGDDDVKHKRKVFFVNKIKFE